MTQFFQSLVGKGKVMLAYKIEIRSQCHKQSQEEPNYATLK